ncbi:hypothetical protein ACFO3H_14925, partial [Halorussus sp. GCM10023401]
VAEDDDAAAGAFDEEEEWRQTTTIPSLNPDRSASKDESEGASGDAAGASAASATSTKGRQTDRQSRDGRSTSGRSSGATGRAAERESARRSTTADSGGERSASDDRRSSRPDDRPASARSTNDDASDEKRRQLRSQLQQREQQVEQLQARVSKVQSERDELERERDALRQEVSRLESRLEATEADAAGGAARQLSRAQAFDGTNLFVRYRSKGEATLDEAAAGHVDASDVNENLRLEHHTQFEAEDVAVDGEEFEAFLHDSFEYRFASWVVEELLYEIRETGHRGGLRDLYESIPKIDRVDLHGAVSAGDEEEGTRQESFDVIMRDRMGNPLVVADLNGSRDPTTGEMMGSLVDASTGVASAHGELAGSFQVTESFFEPEALETAESATSGGILSREKRESFVKLSRKQGYHLCLVESRSGGFHLNVPEL